MVFSGIVVGAFLLGTVFGCLLAVGAHAEAQGSVPFAEEPFSEKLWIDVVPIEALPPVVPSPNGELPQWYNPVLAPSRPIETIGPRYLDMEA